MKWLKGIGLFLVANFLVYLTLSITANILINVVLPAFGIDVRGVFSQQLLVWSLVIGFGGAFLSLAFSKQAARAMLAIRSLVEAYRGIAAVARQAGISREANYRSLWPNDNPILKTLLAVLRVLGVRLRIVAADDGISDGSGVAIDGTSSVESRVA